MTDETPACVHDFSFSIIMVEVSLAKSALRGTRRLAVRFFFLDYEYESEGEGDHIREP